MRKVLDFHFFSVYFLIKRASEYELPHPDFMELGDTFRVNLYRMTDKEPIKADIKAEKADKKPIKADIEPAEADIESAKADIQPEKADIKPIKADIQFTKADNQPFVIISEPLPGSREDILLAYIKAFGFITNKDARELLGLADSTTKRLLRDLTTKGVLSETGERKGRKYFLPDSNH